MKKLVTLFVFLSHFCIAFSQEFQFQMYFEDAIGNKDTLTLGYDPNATEGIDAQFGEQNLINTPLDSVFDIRITDFQSNNNTYHSKKSIVDASCDTATRKGIRTFEIDIKCKNWPVTATWDSAVINTICHRGSFITSFAPGGWFDVGGFSSDLYVKDLMHANKVTFTANFSSTNNWINDYGYVTANNDSISLFWLMLGGEQSLVNVNEIQQQEVKSYPNPVEDFYFIELPNERAIEVTINDITGKSYAALYSNGSVDVRHLPKGFYSLSIVQSNGVVVTKKIVKE